MTELHAISIPDEYLQGSLYPLLYLVPEDIRVRVRRFLRPEPAARTLFGAILMRAILSRKLEIPASQLKITAGSQGKPHLADRPGLEFNLSHSGHWVVLAVGSTPVGVDVESIHKVDSDLAGRFFAPEETAALEALPESKRLALFFSLWTLKESFLKALGTGLSQPLNSFRMDIGADGIIRAYKGCTCLNHIHFKQYAIETAYALSVCAQTPDFAETPRLHTLSDLSDALSRKCPA